MNFSGDRELPFQVPFHRVDMHRLQCVLDFLRDVDHFKKSWAPQQEVQGDAFHGDISPVKFKAPNSAGPFINWLARRKKFRGCLER